MGVVSPENRFLFENSGNFRRPLPYTVLGKEHQSHWSSEKWRLVSGKSLINIG